MHHPTTVRPHINPHVVHHTFSEVNPLHAPETQLKYKKKTKTGKMPGDVKVLSAEQLEQDYDNRQMAKVPRTSVCPCSIPRVQVLFEFFTYYNESKWPMDVTALVLDVVSCIILQPHTSIAACEEAY